MQMLDQERWLAGYPSGWNSESTDLPNSLLAGPPVYEPAWLSAREAVLEPPNGKL
jgi:hypothetical protein